MAAYVFFLPSGEIVESDSTIGAQENAYVYLPRARCWYVAIHQLGALYCNWTPIEPHGVPPEHQAYILLNP